MYKLHANQLYPLKFASGLYVVQIFVSSRRMRTRRSSLSSRLSQWYSMKTVPRSLLYALCKEYSRARHLSSLFEACLSKQLIISTESNVVSCLGALVATQRKTCPVSSRNVGPPYKRLQTKAPLAALRGHQYILWLKAGPPDKQHRPDMPRKYAGGLLLSLFIYRCDRLRKNTQIPN